MATHAGAVVKMPVADTFWGDRYGVLEEPYGHNWSVATQRWQMQKMNMQDCPDAHRPADT